MRLNVSAKLNLKLVGCGLVSSALLFSVAVGQEPKKKTETLPDPAAPASKAKAAPGAGGSVKKQASYGIGCTIAKNLTMQGIELDIEQFIQGIRDTVGGSPKMTDQQIAAVLQAFNKEVEAKQTELAKTTAAKNKQDGEAYLAANKAKPGVTTTKSGLQYKVLKDGTGPLPKATDAVKVQYEGKLIDGTEFDSSRESGPITLSVSDFIAGWTDALLMMKVGSKWQLVVPSTLAYGDDARPGSPIPPGSVLVFEVELLGIEKPKG
jgi:FKBP-type peptidyl-prolyl cis-trans isomerase